MADRVGQQLGNYRLIRLLGRGGFAEVYLSEHLRLGTQAAVKVLHTRLAGHDDVEGFEKEAQTVAHLKHPHIVRVLDYDVEEDTPFLVMDYAVGGTLRYRHPKGTHLPLTTIITYVKQVADALQYAHDQRVIHRDIKPENMLVGEHDDLLLSDFGISIVAQSSRYQHTQQVGGTMAYIAPEQIQGHPRPASDQYSLGIVVYEWLSGNCPFHGSMTEIVAQHLAASPPPLREKVPAIASEVEQVVLTALEKDPRRRFSSVKAFATALEQASQTTQTSPELPGVPLPFSASVTMPAEQTFQAELPIAEIASSPQQPTFQSPLSEPSSPEIPFGPSLSSTIPAQSLFRPDELRTRWRIGQEAPENLGREPFLTPAPGSSRPRRMLIAGISIVAVITLLVATLLGKWIITQELARTPTPTLTASVIPRNTPTPTATLGPVGIITEFPIPTSQGTSVAITTGPDGNLWFTEPDGDKIGRISTSGTITEFPTPTPGSSPYGITVGPDGNLWFAEDVSHKIGRISTSGTITEFPIPTAQSGYSPSEIIAGPDGNLWFIDGDKIGRISTSGTITEFSIPTSQSNSYGIMVGPDHNLWFTEGKSNKIGRISTSGTITELPVLTDGPNFVAVGPDGTLWLTQPISNQIGRISHSGTITEFPVPTATSDPFAITVGPDGNLWFTEWKGNKIGRITSGR
jgi:serine/threonine protein kinase